jgi:putative radical SAM enzyme (TIGR03279 family)
MSRPIDVPPEFCIPERPRPQEPAGIIQEVDPDSWGDRVGIRPGDLLLRVNGHPVEDIIDVQFYAAVDYVVMEVLRDGRWLQRGGPREEGEPLGLTFAHPTFDIDIRRCNNLCPFCFVLQTPKGLRRTLYIKDDDYRYSFLYGHFVTLTNLAERDWRRIVEQRLSPLYISVHATDPEVRRRALRNPRAPDIMAQLRWLAEHGIELHTQIVVTPGLNEGEILERSVFDLVALWPHVRSVSVVPVGVTRFQRYGVRPNTREEARRVLRAVHTWQRAFRRQLGAGFVYATDEWYLSLGRPVPAERAYDGLQLQENGLGMVRDFLEDYRQVKRLLSRRRLRDLPGRRATLVTATLFAPVLERIVRDFNRRTGAALEVVPVVNTRLGETITVAGLLMAEDVVAQLRPRPLGEMVVLPRRMFDHPAGVSLDGHSPWDIAQALSRPVALASTMRDVLTFLSGHGRGLFYPDAEGMWRMLWETFPGRG